MGNSTTFVVDSPVVEGSGSHTASDTGQDGNLLQWQEPFSTARKIYISCVVTMAMFNSTMASGLPGGASPFISSYFDISDFKTSMLPSTLYLIGYIVGPLFFSPMSEEFGRRSILLLTGGLFFSATIGCALSPNFKALLIFRFIAGTGGSAPISVIGGVLADIYADPRVRGTWTAGYTVFTSMGAIMSPLFFCYLSTLGWRWSFWLMAVLSGSTFAGLCFISETHQPYLHRKRTMKALHADVLDTKLGHDYSTRSSVGKVLLVSLTRPVRLLITEAIVMVCSLYCALVFAVLFLLFAGYQHIFHEMYGLTYEVASLAYIPMGVGGILSFPICLAYDSFRDRHARMGAGWAKAQEYQRLPLACIGGPLLTVGLMWLAWTSDKEIHYIVPMMSGIPFAIGLNLVLIALFNYLTDAYGVYASSALAAASCCRSIGGALLPLTTQSLFRSLGVKWGISLLGFFSLVSIAAPVLFIIYGRAIRERSPFCVSSRG